MLFLKNLPLLKEKVSSFLMIFMQASLVSMSPVDKQNVRIPVVVVFCVVVDGVVVGSDPIQ